MATWIVLIDSGYRFEYDSEIDAPTAQAARKAYLNRERGSWRANPKLIKVRRKVA